MWRASLGVIALCACKPPEPVVPGQCAEQWAAAELEALKANVKRDPATAMRRLGVDVEEFEPVAKALYRSWLEKHPEARPRATVKPDDASAATTPSGPRKFENGTLVVSVDHWFWCFTSRGTGVDWCASDRNICEQYKGADDGGCAPTDEMTCYHTRVNGQERPAGWCFKSVVSCKKGMLAWPGPEPIVLGCTTLRYNGAK